MGPELIKRKFNPQPYAHKDQDGKHVRPEYRQATHLSDKIWKDDGTNEDTRRENHKRKTLNITLKNHNEN